jgi:hypothetical protein
MTKRRFGYFVWGVALTVVFIPEGLAASSALNERLPFTTISGMVGHLEYLSATVEIAVTALIVSALVSLLRVPPQASSGATASIASGAVPRRTAGGRLTFRLTPSAPQTAEEFDDGQASLWLVVGAFLSFVLLALATIAARVWWHDPPPRSGEGNALFHPGYVLYGGIGLIWLLLPACFALLPGKDAPFPTLFRTVANVEQWLRGRAWPGSLGPASAWLLVHVIVWGLVFLLIHLTLYPYPDITHILNPSGQ